MKSILIETANDEELKVVEVFVKEHKLKGFIVEDSKANDVDFWNDAIRLLIPVVS